METGRFRYLGALVAVTAGLLTAACGGGADASPSALSTSAPSTATATRTPASTQAAFCAQLKRNDYEIPSFSGRVPDPAVLVPELTRGAGLMRQADPPAAIARDWAGVIADLDDFAVAYASIDVHDPASFGDFERQNGPLISRLAAELRRLQSYAETTCGVQPLSSS